MKKALLFILAGCLSLTAAAQYHSDEFPNYKDYSIPKPENFKAVTRNDLKLTDAFLNLYPEGLPTLDREGLNTLYDYYKNDPDGKKEWAGKCSRTVRIVGPWDIEKAGGFNRYIYSLSCLKDISIVYMFTGNEMLSAFIRGHMHKIANLPMDFWVHAELRGLDPKHPKGCLETAQLNEMLGFALTACKKDMTKEEIKEIEDAWYERGHKTASNWLDKMWKNNWTAVISTGLLYSSKYFNDEELKQKAFKGLKFYVDNTIENDGSYSEGEGYFIYPISCLVRASLVMSKEEINDVFGKSNLKGSAQWRVYGMLFDTDAKTGRTGVNRISFGDNPYGNRGLYSTDPHTYFSENVYRDGVALWIRQKFESRSSSDQLILENKFKGSFPVEPTSPKEANLPLAKAFESGDCFIRNNWDDEGIVLSLKAGDQGSRVGYSHSRPELNSIALGAFGEYLIVTAGSASYRSRIHNEYDICTKAANTITIDGMNQKSTRNPVHKEGRWDNRAVWVKGFPHAIVTACENYPDGGSLLRSEALDAYHLDMKEASRTVKFIPGEEFFIVVDKLTPADGATHKFDYRLHIFNRDEATTFTGKPEMLKVERPNADLYIAMKSNLKAKLVKEDGYMHHPEGRDYDENGPKQGKPGSAIGLDWQSEGTSLHTVAVLFPKRTGAKAPKIKFSGNQVVVNGKKYDIPE